jgi:hypothetical protein
MSVNDPKRTLADCAAPVPEPISPIFTSMLVSVRQTLCSASGGSAIERDSVRLNKGP